MSADRIDPHAADSASPTAEANGTPTTDRNALYREVVMLRARCSNLRHWCRALLNDPAAVDILPEAIAVDLRDTEPEVTEPEGHTVVEILARGGNVPPEHPLAPKLDGVDALRASLVFLTPEHERLRQAFFMLYEHLYPGDNLTDEYFLALQSEPTGPSISELIAELERDEGAKS